VDIAKLARADTVDADLERLISRRASQDQRPEQEELWKASVRAHNSRRREEMRAARHEYHLDQAARLQAALESLVSHHENEAEKYLPKGAS